MNSFILFDTRNSRWFFVYFKGHRLKFANQSSGTVQYNLEL